MRGREEAENRERKEKHIDNSKKGLIKEDGKLKSYSLLRLQVTSYLQRNNGKEERGIKWGTGRLPLELIKEKLVRNENQPTIFINPELLNMYRVVSSTSFKSAGLGKSRPEIPCINY